MSDALRALHASAALTFEERVLQAELELLAANRTAARQLAVDLLSKKIPADVAVRATVVLARAEMFAGDLLRAQQRFLDARAKAHELGEPRLIALAFSQHIDRLLAHLGLEAAASELTAYRRAAQRAAGHDTLATLHRILAEAELKSGRGIRALKELELSKLHADSISNDVVSTQYLIARSSADGLLGHLDSARLHALKAVQLAQRCGAKGLLYSATLNLLHNEVVAGEFARAEATVEELRRMAPLTVSALAILASSELQLAVASRRLDTAREIDGRIWPELSNNHTVSTDWYLLARLDYLLLAGRLPEAVEAGGSRLSSLKPAADRHFADRLRLRHCSALAMSGLQKAAADLIQVVALGVHGQLTEFIGERVLIAGHLTSAGHPREAAEHFSRAARLFGHIGHMVGRAEALYSAAMLRSRGSGANGQAVPPITNFYDKPASTFGRVDAPSDATPETRPAAVAAAVRAASSMIDLMSRPALAGYELLDLLAASEAAAASVLVARKGESTDVLGWTGSDEAEAALRRGSPDAVVLPLGQERDREVSVVVRPANQHGARTTLLALQRLIANGSSLHQAAVSESEKSAIWPEPLPEQQLGFVAVSESMLELLKITRRVAASAITVLVTGETGTGKELLAHAIHNCSPRSKHRFLPFNCTAVPRDMLDSQLFGYRRGAFTGAHDAFPGVIRSAAGGTLLLDEIGEVGLDVQPKLLRFLESGDVHPLGEPAPMRVDVRIVAATNVNLDRAVKEGRFREDLYYRLNVVKLTIPPLRERREEIPLLLDHFLTRCQKESSKSGIRIGETAAEYLLLYDWPGNVRELANEMRRVVALAESDAVVMPEHLSPRIADSRRTVPAGQRPPTPTELLVRRDQPLSAAVEHVERALIMDALRRHGNVEDAARALGLSRKGLYLKRQRLKIDEV